jgi:hypothetical protein
VHVMLAQWGGWARLRQPIAGGALVRL